MSGKDVLGPLLESLCRGKLPPAGRLSGQRVITKSRDRTAWICLDNRDNVHLLIAPATQNKARFKRFKMPHLSFGVQEWVISEEKAGRYIDITCKANRKSAMRRPFLSFCGDVLVELNGPANPDEAVYRTALRWQRFWNSPPGAAVSDDWIHGFAAELLFLRDLIKDHGPATFRSWTGAAGHDHDFQSNGVGIEIKATLTQPPILKVNNLNQLDHTLFEDLYVVVYGITMADRGHQLPAIVREIEGILGAESELCDRFWRALAGAGYQRELEERYSEAVFTVVSQIAYRVDDAFPKLTTRSLAEPLDSRIRNIRYQVRLTGLPSLNPHSASFRGLLRRLASSSAPLR